VIQVDNASVAFSGDPVFEGVSFTINSGERCGLVGRNGSGKTTLFRLLVGQEEADSGNITFSKGYKLGYLDQHIRFTKDTVLDEAALGLKAEERELLYKAETILAGLGFQEEQFDLPPAQLSGGYSLRLHLAKVLLSEPDCLLLDEPTNYLDILSIRFLTQFLKEWKGELLIVSHDREFLDAVTTHILGIHRKKVRKVKGTTIDFFKQIVQEEEIQERTRINQEKKREHLQSYIERFGAKASKAAQAQSKQKMLDRIPVLEQLKSLYQLDFSFPERPFPGKKMLEAKGISFGYDTKPVIQDLSLAIERGMRLAIIGKNGYGKSTLLRLLIGELAPKQGQVTSSEQTAIGYFGQTHIQRLHKERTIEEEIADANTTLNFSAVKRICGLMMFPGDTAKKPISVLSGGEKSRVLLGRILAKPCNLLILDEPTHHLDIESIEALIDALEDFEGAVIIVTHSELILKRLHLDKLVVCHAGRQEVFTGNYEEFLESEGWEEEAPVASPPKRVEKIAAPPARPKNLKPLQQEITRLEKEIADLEAAQGKDQEQLIALSQKNESRAIQDLVKKTREREKAITTKYEELSSLIEKYDAMR
jgi:ATP-binding cassette subfamily F protein 3